ncbi:protein RESTRICTED TEV MOVEMENT 2-like [Arachis duranensis]|uniref:Protein RESTRICTED TEV MOVEMENT 2-like n=1 Tax=Arachis duranensis TaxID=130453 RepID=A0A6P4DSY0_ARADU|nr:protein RESTRICTED TEV MOVEMENT 2-like [Arachis duranensis]
MEQQPMSTAIYEDLKPKQELKEEREAFILLVHIPTGFERQHYGAKVEFDYSRVRVFGEQPLENNKIKRFNIVHQVPPTCDINRITGKILDGSIVSIKMPKKVPSDPVPQTTEIEEEPKTSPEAKPGEDDTEQQATTEKEEPKASTEAEAGKDNDEPDGPPPQQENVAAEAEVDEDKRGISDHDHEEPKSSTEQNKFDDDKKAADAVAAGGDGNVEREGKEESEEDVKKSAEEEKERSEEKVCCINDERIKSESAAVVGGLKGMVTGFVKRLEEEDKRRRVIYMSAAVVVVALGVYASFKFRSSSLLRK